MEKLFRVIEKDNCIEIFDAINKSKNTVNKNQLENLIINCDCPILNCSSYGR